MFTVDRIYKKAFRRNFTNHEANFPPTKEIGLGDYGVMKHGYFSKLGNVADLNVQFQEKPDTNPTQEKFKSSSEINVQFFAKGQVNVDGTVNVDAKVEVSFGKEDAIFFSSAEVKYNEVKDIAKLGEEILTLYKQKKWKKEYYIVTRVLQGRNAIILISGGNNCKVDIGAKVDVPKIDLADGGVGLEITNSSQTAYEIIADGDCTIGMGMSRVYDTIFIKPDFRILRANVEAFALLDHTPGTQVVFGDVIPENYDPLIIS